MDFISKQDYEIIELVQSEILKTLKELLETKHLYQSISFNYAPIQDLIDNPDRSFGLSTKKTYYQFEGAQTRVGQSSSETIDPITAEHKQKIQKATNEFRNEFWMFSTGISEENHAQLVGGIAGGPSEFDFILPDIQISCSHCKKIFPHNAGYRGQIQEFKPLSEIVDGIPHQTFMFPYQCQACKGEPLVFLVHRKGMKFTLTGRNHFETIQVPKAIPREEREFYSDAIAAYNTGNILAGLFMLRTTIEQYMRRILVITDRMSGEDLADQYLILLDKDFPKDRYPSLKKIYMELSKPIHEAEKDAKQFEKSKADIEKHFELLKLIPLKQQQS